MTDKQIIEELLSKGEVEISQNQIIKNYKVSNIKARQINFALRMMTGQTELPPPQVKKEPAKKVKVPKPSAGMGISEKELRLRYDNRFIVSQKVKELEPDKFLTTAEFVQICKLKTNAGYKQVLDHSDFDHYRGKAGGVTYWGHPSSVAKLKEDGVLT